MTAAPKSAELLACPWCQSTDVSAETESAGFNFARGFVECLSCRSRGPLTGLVAAETAADLPVAHVRARRVATAAWNTRAADQTPAAPDENGSKSPPQLQDRSLASQNDHDRAVACGSDCGRWKLVPVEASMSMLNAAIDTDSRKLGDISPLGFRCSPQMMFERCWSAMLSASPPAAGAEDGRRSVPKPPIGASLFAVNCETGAWHYINHADTWQGAPSPLDTPRAYARGIEDAAKVADRSVRRHRRYMANGRKIGLSDAATRNDHVMALEARDIAAAIRLLSGGGK